MTTTTAAGAARSNMSRACTERELRKRTRTALAARFERLSIPEPNSGCWIFLGGLSCDGYGHMSIGGTKLRASRAFYEFFRSPISPGLQIDHLCRNRACVNPFHLEPVTPLVNTLRGTGPSAKNAQKTHCAAGHEFSAENTRITPKRTRSSRVCRTCVAHWSRIKRRKLSGAADE